MVQLDHDEEMVPMHGMYGTLDAELDLQLTIKRAELTAFLCLTRKASGPTMVHVDNKGFIDGLWRGAMRLALFSHQRLGCNSTERDVRGDMCRYRNDATVEACSTR